MQKVFIVLYHSYMDHFYNRKKSSIHAVFEVYEDAMDWLENRSDKWGSYEIIEATVTPRSVAISSETVDDC